MNFKAFSMTKYKLLNPSTAIRLDVYAMKNSVVMANTAGSESKANIMSVVSIAIKTKMRV